VPTIPSFTALRSVQHERALEVLIAEPAIIDGPASTLATP
jgi:hypothetical protein